MLSIYKHHCYQNVLNKSYMRPYFIDKSLILIVFLNVIIKVISTTTTIAH